MREDGVEISLYKEGSERMHQGCELTVIVEVYIESLSHTIYTMYRVAEFDIIWQWLRNERVLLLCH